MSQSRDGTNASSLRKKHNSSAGQQAGNHNSLEAKNIV